MPIKFNPFSLFKKNKQADKTQPVNAPAEKGSFKKAANDNNGNVSIINKNLGSLFSSQKGQIKQLTANVENIEEQTQQNTKKIDKANSLLQQSISVQNDILKTLKMLIKESAVKSSNGGKGASLASNLLTGMGVSAAGIALIMGQKSEGDDAKPVSPSNNETPLANVENKTILEVIKQRESTNNYKAEQKPPNTASGAYQFIDTTWKGLTKQFSIGTEYNRAKDAPPAIQDAVADKYISDILKRHNGDVSWVPREWYGGPKGYLNDKEQKNNKYSMKEYQDLWMRELERKNSKNNTAVSSPTRGVSADATKQGGEMQNQQTETPIKTDGGKVSQDQMKEAGIRKLPISPELLAVLEKAAREAGVDVKVKSGGQPAQTEGGQRTGSTRHDKGMAADLDIYSGEKKLTPKNSEDLPIFKKFVMAASAAGATGIGAGEGYMDSDGARMHVGFGSQAIWGAGGAGKNAAGWLREATGGAPGGETPGPGPGPSRGMSAAREEPEQPQQRGYTPQQDPRMGMMNPYAALGGMIGGRQGAGIGGLAGILIPAIENLLGGLQGSSTASMQPNNPYLDQSRSRTRGIDQAAVTRETQQETPAPQPAAQPSPTQQNVEAPPQQRETDTRATPEWIGNFRAGLKHAYMDFDGKMIYI